jgi:penicillin-binding protein 2
MENVVREPLGTARDRFRGFSICVAAKTGTAEDPGLSGEQEPDAWFVGYTCEGREGKPDIAIAVVVANQGQGSAFAAPIFRRVVEAYYGLPYVRYPWEEAVGVPRPEPTPTPEGGVPVIETETPTPSP